MTYQVIPNIDQKEKAAQFLWTGFILAFFLIQAVIWIIAITFTAGDKSHAVVPDYDERALNWDDEIAVHKASSQLGWKAILQVDVTGDIRGVRALTVQLNDKDETPVGGATIELNAFHRARAGAPQSITLTEVNTGVYTGNITIRKNGLWQFEGRARKGDSVFLIQEQHLLEANR